MYIIRIYNNFFFFFPPSGSGFVVLGRDPEEKLRMRCLGPVYGTGSFVLISFGWVFHFILKFPKDKKKTAHTHNMSADVIPRNCLNLGRLL